MSAVTYFIIGMTVGAVVSMVLTMKVCMDTYEPMVDRWFRNTMQWMDRYHDLLRRKQPQDQDSADWWKNDA